MRHGFNNDKQAQLIWKDNQQVALHVLQHISLDYDLNGKK